MRIDILSAQPALLDSPLNHSILKRAQEKQLVTIYLHDLHDYAINKHKQIDDYAFGGGAGMVLMIEPIHKCIEQLKAQRKYDEVIYLSPDGLRFNQSEANQLSLKKNIILLCGHYKGIDERVRTELVTKEISIGDYVLSGGELPAAILVDAVCRLLPGVLNNECSALFDSFQDNLIAPPVYTRPANYNGWEVPEILTSGHQGKVDQWRHEQSVARTKARRPDLLEE